MLFAFALVMQQAAQPRLEVRVDRDRVRVGAEVTMVVTAISASAEPLRVSLPPIDGLTLVGRSERSEVSHGPGGVSRTTTLELRLRAQRPGRWPLGPVTGRQGGVTVRAPAVEVTVGDAAGGSGPTALSPRVRDMLQRAPPPPRPGEPALQVLLSTDTAYVGEQVELVTLAWFPQELRGRLRRPPLLQPPTMDGVWLYPQPVPGGVAATRNVGGVAYDIFASHQVVFPVMPGTQSTSPAVLRYSVPLALQFFSQEEHFERRSDSMRIHVLALPAGGRPAGFAGAVGRGLTIERTVEASGQVRVGEAVTVDYTLEGEGNVALWPAPALDWPPALRAYTDRVDESTELAAGAVRGRKRFRYLVVPDSTGSWRLPGVRYVHFDPATRSWATATLEPGLLPVGRSGESTRRAEPPPLPQDGGVPLARRAVGALPGVGWVALWLLPPLTVGLRLLLLRRRRRTTAAVGLSAPTLRGVEAELDRLLRGLVPDTDAATGAGLHAALRASGLDGALARRVVETRERLLAERYGPEARSDSAGADAAGAEPSARLAAEAAEVLEAVRAARRGTRRRRVTLGGLLLPLLLLHPAAPALATQAPAPEQLYRNGSLRAAAEGFARRAAREPYVAAHWYGYGASLYRLGEDGRAAAAWLRSARLAPRDPSVRRALRLVPPDPASAELMRVAPATPEELLVLATLLWVAGWALVLRGSGRRRAERERIASRAALGLALALGVAALALDRWYGRPLGVAAGAVELRLSPHGRAPVTAQAADQSALRIERRVPGWALVRSGAGQAGWAPAEAIAVVRDARPAE
jgi:hypothetical protein